MDAFLAPLSLIFSHSATALLLQIMNRLVQKSIHSGFTFVFKQPLSRVRGACHDYDSFGNRCEGEV